MKSPGAPGEALILANVRNTIMVNHELRPEVMFLDNNRCVQLITKASGASLAAAFQQARTSCVALRRSVLTTTN